jgi:hypothetical protein
VSRAARSSLAWPGPPTVVSSPQHSSSASWPARCSGSSRRPTASSPAARRRRREHAKAHAKAAKRLEAAKTAVERLPATSPRLEKAEAAKKAADAAVVAKASERGCVSNCRQLLEKAVDDAAAEVKAARAALDAGNQKARDELANARAALTGMKAPVSPTPLADRTGIPAWVLELFDAEARRDGRYHVVDRWSGGDGLKSVGGLFLDLAHLSDVGPVY